MTNLLEKYEQQQIEKLSQGKVVPEFQPGDTIRVNVRIIEGKAERIQAFEGLCIARKNRGINSAFTVRKISHGEGVERIFPLYSPRVESIELVRKGVVRRSKLYYMRDLTGKAARIQEKRDGLALVSSQSEVPAAESNEPSDMQVAPAKKRKKAKATDADAAA